MSYINVIRFVFNQTTIIKKKRKARERKASFYEYSMSVVFIFYKFNDYLTLHYLNIDPKIRILVEGVLSNL